MGVSSLEVQTTSCLHTCSVFNTLGPQLQQCHSDLHKDFISNLQANLTCRNNQIQRPKKRSGSQFSSSKASERGMIIPKQATHFKTKVLRRKGRLEGEKEGWASHSTAMPQESATFNVIKLYIAAIWKQFQSINNSCKKTAEEQKNQILS